jgi:hypothetical protein
LDQAAWEAPNLRSIFVGDLDGPDTLPGPCPSRCEQDHPVEKRLRFVREHRSTELSVREDHERYYVGDDIDEGIAAHLSFRLVEPVRDTGSPRISMWHVKGDGHGDPIQVRAGSFYFDEVREIIAVLQHLLKVGLEGSTP